MGIAKFETFLRAYIEKFAFEAITTTEFKQFLCQILQSDSEKLESVDWDGWLNGTGLPAVRGKWDTSLQDVCTEVSVSTTRYVHRQLNSNLF